MSREALLTKDGNWHNEGQVNEQELGKRRSAIGPKDWYDQKRSCLRTWKSPRFDPEVYKKLTVENWMAE